MKMNLLQRLISIYNGETVKEEETPTKNRKKYILYNLRLTQEEHENLKAISEATGESIQQWLMKRIRDDMYVELVLRQKCVDIEAQAEAAYAKYKQE